MSQPARRVLDVGCGSGPLFAPLALHGIHVVGIDPAEAMVALVLAEACLEKFGGDSVDETRRNHAAYLSAIPETMRSW